MVSCGVWLCWTLTNKIAALPSKKDECEWLHMETKCSPCVLHSVRLTINTTNDELPHSRKKKSLSCIWVYVTATFMNSVMTSEHHLTMTRWKSKMKLTNKTVWIKPKKLWNSWELMMSEPVSEEEYRKEVSGPDFKSPQSCLRCAEIETRRVCLCMWRGPTCISWGYL